MSPKEAIKEESIEEFLSTPEGKLWQLELDIRDVLRRLQELTGSRYAG